MKDPVEVQLPSSNSVLVILCMKKPRDCAPPDPFDYLPLDLRQGSAIKSIISEPLKFVLQVQPTSLIGQLPQIRTD